MKMTAVAALGIAVLLITGIAAVAMAHPNGLGGNTNNQGNRSLSCRNLTAGETLTVSGLKGRFQDVNTRTDTGNASGSLTLQVSNIYFSGCTLSITGGTLGLGYGTFSITGGSVVLNKAGRNGFGSGTISGGSFLIQISGLRGNSTSASLGAVSLDLNTGTGEFLIHLHR